MRKIWNSIKRASSGRWKTLTTGEKVIKVIVLLLKIAIVLTIGLLAICVIGGIHLACSIMDGLGEAVDDQIYRSNVYNQRRRYYW